MRAFWSGSVASERRALCGSRRTDPLTKSTDNIQRRRSFAGIRALSASPAPATCLSVANFISENKKTRRKNYNFNQRMASIRMCRPQPPAKKAELFEVCDLQCFQSVQKALSRSRSLSSLKTEKLAKPGTRSLTN